MKMFMSKQNSRSSFILFSHQDELNDDLVWNLIKMVQYRSHFDNFLGFFSTPIMFFDTEFSKFMIVKIISYC